MMTGKEAMRYAMEQSGNTQQRVAELAGYARQTNVSEVLRSKNARLDNFIRIVNACGYEVEIRNKEHPDERFALEAEQ